MGPERNRTDDDQEGSGSGDEEEGEVVFRHIWLDSLMCFKLFDLFINVNQSGVKIKYSLCIQTEHHPLTGKRTELKAN